MHNRDVSWHAYHERVHWGITCVLFNALNYEYASSRGISHQDTSLTYRNLIENMSECESAAMIDKHSNILLGLLILISDLLTSIISVLLNDNDVSMGRGGVLLQNCM